MNISAAGVNLIKEFEGFPYGGRPYKDAVGVWTIGYGETKNVGPHTVRITQTKAEQMLKVALNTRYEPPVERAAKEAGITLNQHEFDALVSAVYNLGPGVLDKGRSLGDALRTRNRRKIADAFLLYDKAGGRTLAGLTRRRRAERSLFLSPVTPGPLKGYTENEKRWIREYDKLLRADKDIERRRVLRRVMTEQRKRIWHAAKQTGWDIAQRKQRYASLLARTR